MQWGVLLVASLVFYALAGVENTIFILITSVSTYGAARWIDRRALDCTAFLKANKETMSKEDRKLYKQRNVRSRKAILTVTMLLNFGILCVFK